MEWAATKPEIKRNVCYADSTAAGRRTMFRVSAKRSQHSFDPSKLLGLEWGATCALG
jgi:hypothetical protein